MVVVSLVTKLVAEFPVFQQHAADLVGFHEQTQAPKNGSATHTRQGGAEVLGGERPALGGNRADDEATGLSIAVPHAGEMSHDVVHDGSRTRSGVMVAGVFQGGTSQNETPSRILEGAGRVVKWLAKIMRAVRVFHLCNPTTLGGPGPYNVRHLIT